MLIRLLVNAEKGRPIFDFLYNLGAQVKGAVVDVIRFQTHAIDIPVERDSTVRTEGQPEICVRMSDMIIFNDLARLDWLVGDGQDFGLETSLRHGVNKALTARIQTGVTNGLVDTDTSVTSVGLDHQLTALITPGVFILPDVGCIRDALFLWPPVRGVVGDDRNAAVNRPHHRLLKHLAISYAHTQRVRLGGKCPIYVLSRLFWAKRLGREKSNFNAQSFCRISASFLHRTPESIPGTGTVRHQVYTNRLL